jgi:NAD(P)H-flavin reductase
VSLARAAHGCVATLPGGDPWRSHPARIEEIADEVPGVRTYTLRLLDDEVRRSYRFAPGQFNMLHLPGIGEAAISISSDPLDTERLEHTVRAVGNVTDALSRMQPGETLLLRGPFGRPWPVADLAGREVVVVAGGLGLASQRAAIHELLRHRTRYAAVTVLHGAKEPAGLFYTGEYDRWRDGGVEVQTIVDAIDASPAGDLTTVREPAARSSGRVGLVTDLLAELPLDPARVSILCCGPDPMMMAVVRAALARGVAPAEIFLSLERNMACAVRHCGLCQFGPVFVCQEGPVFSYPVIEPYLSVRQM